MDSFAPLAAATIQGSTETTFYVLAMYFGAFGIQKAGHAMPCVLVAAVGVTYWFLNKPLGVLERYLVGRVFCCVQRWAKNTFRNVLGLPKRLAKCFTALHDGD